MSRPARVGHLAPFRGSFGSQNFRLIVVPRDTTSSIPRNRSPVVIPLLFGRLEKNFLLLRHMLLRWILLQHSSSQSGVRVLLLA